MTVSTVESTTAPSAGGAFHLDPEFVSQYSGRQPEWGFGVLSYVVYKRTYARQLPGSAGTEEYWQTCERVVNGVFELQRRHLPHAWDPVLAQIQAQTMFRFMWDFKFLPPGRGLWSMGAPLLMDRGHAGCVYNCAFRSTKDIDTAFSAPFRFLLEASAVGVGVGFDTRGEGKVVLVAPKKGPRWRWTWAGPARVRHVIADSREGWSEALGLVLEAYAGRGTLPELDYSCIRPFGAPIKTFGGTASGPEALRELLEVDIPEILSTPGQPISSGQIVDVMNAIGKCVVAGGARRSAEIALGRHDDEEFARLKTDKEKVMRWRWASNNSIMAPRSLDDYARFADLIIQSGGEPGFVWLDNCREYGRFVDGYRGDDMGILGMNPCSEIGLEDGELCNVVEEFPARCESLDEFIEVARCAFLYAKTVSLLPTPWALTNDAIRRNRRIGVSLSGIVQNIAKRGESTHYEWCDAAYKALRAYDAALSELWRVARSLRLTTIKPGGTIPLLTGSTSGVHEHEDLYIIRRVNFPKNSELVAALEEAGYHAEDNAYEASSEVGAKSRVVSFPIKATDFVRGKRAVSMRDQLELVAKHQYWWADNAISVTVTLQEHEYGDLADAIRDYRHRIKTVSFLPLDNHGYVQPPLESIDEGRYNDMVGRLKPLPMWAAAAAEHEVTERFCDGESCQIRYKNA